MMEAILLSTVFCAGIACGTAFTIRDGAIGTDPVGIAIVTLVGAFIGLVAGLVMQPRATAAPAPTVTRAPVLCTSCRWFVPSPHCGSEYGKCRHPSVASLVDGSAKEYAEHLRDPKISGKCGPGARMWDAA